MLSRIKFNITHTAQAVLLSTGLLASVQTMATDLYSELVAVSPTYQPCEPINIQISLTNKSVTPLRVLPWGTPIEGMYSDSLKVTRYGKEIPYMGPMASRREPLPRDKITLLPGVPRKKTLDISLYAFKLPGRYKVDWRDKEIDGHTVETTPTTFDLVGIWDCPINRGF